MNKWLGGVVACGLAGLTAVGFAPPGGAQEPPEPTEVLLEATVSPEVAEPGETITVTSVEPCSFNEGFEESGTLSWVWFSEEDFESFDFGDVPLNADGSWEVTFAAPDISGGFFFSAGCFPDGWEEEDAFCFSESEEPVEPAEDLTAATSDDETPPSTEPPTTEPPAKPPFDCVFEFYDTGFEVVGGQPPTTTPPGQPTPPPPAIPVPGQPSTTG